MPDVDKYVFKLRTNATHPGKKHSHYLQLDVFWSLCRWNQEDESCEFEGLDHIDTAACAVGNILLRKQEDRWDFFQEQLSTICR